MWLYAAECESCPTTTPANSSSGDRDLSEEFDDGQLHSPGMTSTLFGKPAEKARHMIPRQFRV
jgi:hypothetical protein